MKEETVYELKTLIGQFDKARFIEVIIKNLRKHEEMHILERVQTTYLQPWKLVTLIELCLSNRVIIATQRVLDDESMSQIIRIIHESEDGHLTAYLTKNQTSGINKSLRVMAFQQFYYQNRNVLYDFGKLWFIFETLKNDYLESEFLKKFQLLPTEAIRFLFLLYVFFKERRDLVSITIDSSVSKFFNLTKLKIFFDLLSKNLNSSSLDFSDIRHIKNLRFIDWGQSPLIYYPFIQITNNRYFFLGLDVYEQTIESALFYMIMKSKSDYLINAFTRQVEKYVAYNLKSHNIEFEDEEKLKKCYPKSKVTDFILPSEDCTIFIEVKAIEASHWVQVFQENEKIKNEYKNDVIKAMQQGLELANSIRTIEQNVLQINKEIFFLLVITYKPLHLGTGSSIWNEFAEEILSKLLSNDQISSIAPCNIFVVSLVEFDLMVQASFDQNISLSQLIKRMVKDNEQQETTSFNVYMHLIKYFDQLNYPNFVIEAFDDLKSRLI